MSPRTKQFLWGTEMGRRFFLLATFGLSTLGFAGWVVAQGQVFSDLTVHEWGTFTGIAGKHGEAIAWTPLRGSTDLPGFVEHFSETAFKSGLRGTIRMETPVMYFYSPHEATVSVRVAFAKGVITEWYPHAAHVEMGQMHTSGTIAWDDVSISPDLVAEFPHEDQASRYYAARETASSPLLVNTPEGAQQEKFLFYRGVSAAPLLLSAKVNADSSLFIKNLGQEEIPALILFERRGERVGYRSAGVITNETVLDPPRLDSTVDTLCAELEAILIERGLFSDEAHAMVATWRDSWFEEGSRLIYIVPRSYIDNVLPLAIDPAPTQIVRVFVGRLELVTPATVRAVETAVASHDEATLNKYGRFLEPILQTVRENQPELAQENRLNQ
jgi:hypothetical protein